MNLLSVISLFASFSFSFSAWWVWRKNPLRTVNITAALTNLAFAWWAFCYAYFYSAPDQTSAWFWHRWGALGWISFCSPAIHFFLAFGRSPKARHPFWLGLLYLPPLFLASSLLWSPSTAVAVSVVESPTGWGWTYVSAAGSPLYWVYVGYLVVFFSLGFAYLLVTSQRSQRPRFVKQARALVVLDLVILVLCVYSDLVAPNWGSEIPPLANILSTFWLVGFLVLIRNYQLIDLRTPDHTELVLETVQSAVFLLSPQGQILQGNRAAAKLFQVTQDELNGLGLDRFLLRGTYDPVNVQILWTEKHLGPIELDIVTRTGKILQVQANYTLAESPLDGVIGIVANFTDITRLKGIEKELEVLASTDKLTGLPNRRQLFQYLNEVLERATKSKNRFAVLFSDLDGFKGHNDRYGHNLGDDLLVAVGDRLTRHIEGHGMAARVGGDEFVLVYPDVESEDDLESQVNSLRRTFETPLQIGSVSCPLGLSLGTAWFPDDGIRADDLLRAADQKMYFEKRRRQSTSSEVHGFRKDRRESP